MIKNGRNFYLLGALLVLMALASPSVAGGPGTVGAEYLLLSPSARVSALGNAYTAEAREAYGAYWNPAGAAQHNQKRLSTTFTFYLMDTEYEYLSYLHPLSPDDALAFSMTGFQVSDDKRDANGNQVGSFTNSDLAAAVTYSRKFQGDYYAGATVKLLHRNLDVYNASGFALDAGLLGPLPLFNWRWGMSVSNIGSELKFIQEGDPLPLTWRGGLGARALDDKLLMLFDLSYTKGSGLSSHMGMEWNPLTMIFLRVGYERKGEESIEDGFRAGFGLHQSIGDIDYSYGRFGELGYVHRFSYSLAFGAPAEDAAVIEQREQDRYEEEYGGYFDPYYQETRQDRSVPLYEEKADDGYYPYYRDSNRRIDPR